MDQLEDALGKLLNDPGAMSQVMQLAQSLGASVQSAPEQETVTLAPVPAADRRSALLQALEPYLSPERRQKLRRAMQLARLSGLMKTVMQLPDREDPEAI